MRSLKRIKILGMSLTTVLLIGGVAYIFRDKLAPLFDKIKSLIHPNS